MRVLVIAAAIAGLSYTSCMAQQRAGIVQPIQAKEFLQLPEDLQVVYVGGILEGMSYTAYGYSVFSDYPQWVACIRQKTLGETTKDVVAFIKGEPGTDEGVASAVAQTLGRRCPHDKPGE